MFDIFNQLILATLADGVSCTSRLVAMTMSLDVCVKKVGIQSLWL